MNEKLAEAMNFISGRHISEAAAAKRKRRHLWLLGTAAVLALVLLLNSSGIPMVVSAQAISTASGSRAPVRDDYDNWQEYLAVTGAQETLVEESLKTLESFFTESTQLYMSGARENRVWSPVNAFIALAMLAEVTDGNSRQQILDVLNTTDLDILRAQVGAVWESVYRDDGHEISLLANSLWLNEDLEYSQQAMDDLAYYYYASIYRADLSSSKAANALGAWLNSNTGGLLKKNITNVTFPQDAVLTLASTVYLQSKWADEFSAGQNTTGLFHAPGADVEVTYMNKKAYHAYYHWGDSYGAVALSLKNGCKMWFFLPDEDKTVDDVLGDGQYLTAITHGSIYQDTDSQKYMKVNLSVPKFDVSSSADLKTMLTEMGITDIFNQYFSDFTAITSGSPVFITSVNQSARVIIDEQGVKAASYIEIPGAGAAAPPEEIIDFILDRPFLFVIADSSGIPLFTGVVNDPS